MNNEEFISAQRRRKNILVFDVTANFSLRKGKYSAQCIHAGIKPAVTSAKFTRA